MIFIKLGYNTKLKLCKPLKFQSVVHNCLLRGRTEERDGMVRERKRWQDDTYESNDIGSAFKNPCKHFQLKNCPAICQLQFPRFAFSFSTFYSDFLPSSSSGTINCLSITITIMRQRRLCLAFISVSMQLSSSDCQTVFLGKEKWGKLERDVWFSTSTIFRVMVMEKGK